MHLVAVPPVRDPLTSAPHLIQQILSAEDRQQPFPISRLSDRQDSAQHD